MDEHEPVPGALGVVRDMSAHKSAERERAAEQTQLRHQQKLEAIGTLASGVAHEINNPIQSIMNYAQLIRRRSGSDELQEYAGEILHEAQRVAAIVRNLLSFARQEGEPYAEVQAATLVANSLSLISAMLRKEGISISVDVSVDLPLIRCHPQQIQQALMNLLTNARDALNERYTAPHENKVIAIAGRRSVVAEKEAVRITVEDHGVGVAPDVIDKIFDPFMASTSHRSGAGLGLAIAYGIVHEHGGAISAESQLGRFTRFHLDLPVAALTENA